jgi:hypothetical protein
MREERTLTGKRSVYRRVAFLLAFTLLASLGVAPWSMAAEERSYPALLSWLQEYRDATPAFQPGQHLTTADQEALKPFVPLPAWEFYFYPEMDMEIAPTGYYPPPEGWGASVVPGYALKEDGALVGFTGGGFPFPEIKPDDPQAAVKVLWNSANGFILYGKGGEIATNRREEQELTMLSLHLLQLCLVYINTLMLQRILGEPHWDARLTPDDLRGLTPLMYHHVTPYGIFRLDMNDRLMIEEARAA